ncbi:DUF4158 domain-containing protein, partial [Streptosporangium sandarakinum]|uniref:DUF4158 domain-containing protein n=1 Tax=Streptosporangium sandarakinum TaxID=1260955 RepID=UPI0037238C5B
MRAVRRGAITAGTGVVFRLDASALERAWLKRRPHNRLGWAVQWGTVRMLGTFLPEPSQA